MGLWKPAECWKLPPNPYKNHTRSPSGLEYLKLVVVGLTLFLPRVILVVLTSAPSTPRILGITDTARRMRSALTGA